MVERELQTILTYVRIYFPNGWSGFGLLFCLENNRCRKRDQMRYMRHWTARGARYHATGSGLDISVISTFVTDHGWSQGKLNFLIPVLCCVVAGAIIGYGDRKSLDPRAPMIWDYFSIFRTNCAVLMSYIRADPRTCRGLSRGLCHVAWSNGESCEILLQIFHSDGRE